MFERGRYLARMLRAERQSPARLRAAQNKALKALVRHAATRVPYYRDLYAQHGIDAGSFRGLDDLGKLPMVGKRDLRAAGDRALAEDRPPDLVRISTSGSSGEPFSFLIDRRYDSWRKAQYLRPYLTNGRRLADGILHLTAHPVRRKPLHARLGLLREWQLNGAGDPARIVAAWRDTGATILQGYPSTLRDVAHHVIESGLSFTPVPRRVFTDSELLSPDTRALLERAFGTAPIDVFGSYETDNIAYQCVERGGHHVTLDSVVLEVCRSDGTSRPGETGELVATVLANRTHPFIRYRLGDVGRFAAVPCACGRAFPLLEVISGRAVEMLLLPDGCERSALDSIGRLQPFSASIRQYQLHQLALDRFELWIVPAAGYSEDDGRAICRTLEETLDPAGVAIRLVDALPPGPSGKLKTFVRHCQVRPDAR